MAFAARSGERPKSLIFRTPAALAPGDDSQSAAPPLSPIRNQANTKQTTQSQASRDIRNSLQRRYTTNATLPSLAPIGEQRRQANGQADDSAKMISRMSPAEARARQYEALLAQQRRIQAQMAMIDPETRREVDEANRLEQEISSFVLSEPETSVQKPRPTPIRNHTTSSFPNRFPTSNPAKLSANPNRRSQVKSPQGDHATPYLVSGDQHTTEPAVSSQRTSEHEASDTEDLAYGFSIGRQPAGASRNRNSMPVTGFDLRAQNRHSASFSPILAPTNTSSFFFGDEDGRLSKRSSAMLTASPDTKTFLQLHQTDDKFPILLRRGTDSHFSGTATPLELPEDSGPEGFTRTDRAVAVRHRQSLPPGVIQRNSGHFGDALSGLDSILSDSTTAKNTAANRRSLEVRFGGPLDAKRPGLMVSPLKNGLHGLQKVPTSYSTNDIPTLKTVTNLPSEVKSATSTHTPQEAASPPVQLSQAHFVVAPTTTSHQVQSSVTSQAQRPVHSDLHIDSTSMTFDTAPGTQSYYQSPPQYVRPLSGYSAQNMNGLYDALGNFSVSGPQSSHWQNSGSHHGQHGGFNHYSGERGHAGGRYGDGFARGPGNRRSGHQNEESLRIANTPLEALKGEIYGLCKDQHGCRFLQKKLEERTTENTSMIFDETLPHVVELMTDPFGNYLCQKLLEYASDTQRTALIEAASPYMIRIALNQHGTRALQKMIEFINTQQQIDMVIQALRHDVVQLIQDLNGNHVIQKCLNHLKQENIQFIVDAVCLHVVTVGTHRHGCCVLQRCIDHASGMQKGQLVGAITRSVFQLVQDPFGNYVVQYILDLAEPAFSEPLCLAMVGSVPALACQKFSSNVIEKGIRTAGDDTRRQLVREMLNPTDLQRMLRDSFANYVVQTAMDYADDETKAALFDTIRPILPNIRHTPHGRRIATKMQEHDTRAAMGSRKDGFSPPGPMQYALSGAHDMQARPSYPAGPPYPMAPPPLPASAMAAQNGGFAGPGAPHHNGGYANHNYGIHNGNHHNQRGYSGYPPMPRTGPNHF